MPKKIEEVSTVKISFECDNCRVGFLEFTGVSLPMVPMAGPPLHQHMCRSCGFTTHLIETFPRIDFLIKDKNN